MEPDYKRAYNEISSFVNNFNLMDVMKDKLPIDSQTIKLLKENK